MKKYILLFLAIPSFSFAQMKSCCSTSSTEKFAMLASNEEFVAAHLAPLPLEFTPEKGSMVTFNCKDSVKGNAFVVKAASPTDNWLIVFHEWWGLNDYIKREAEKFSTELPNVNILAIDLYDGKVAETPAIAQELMQGVKDERARNIINGAIKYVGPKAKIGTLGWCFGGGWSLQAGIMSAKQAVACVMYYGMPETDMAKLKSLNSDVFGIFAGKDAWITPTLVKNFEINMKNAGKKLTVRTYDADHAFANPSNPKFDKVSAENAHGLVISYLKTKMK